MTESVLLLPWLRVSAPLTAESPHLRQLEVERHLGWFQNFCKFHFTQWTNGESETGLGTKFHEVKPVPSDEHSTQLARVAFPAFLFVRALIERASR